MSKAGTGKLILAGVVVTLVTIITYLEGVKVPFYFDDRTALVDNLALRDISQLHAIWGYSATRFLGFLSFAADYYFWELDPRWSHLVNILIHSFNTLLVFLIALQISVTHLKLNKRSIWTAVFVAFLFGLHPIQSQAVLYLVQRLTLLCATFYFLAVYSYLRFLGDQRFSKKWIYATVGFTILAAFSKQNAFTLPINLVMLSFLFPGVSMTKKQLLPVFSCIAVIPLLMLFFSDVEQARVGSGFIHFNYTTPYTYFLTQLKVLTIYLRKLFWPSDLSLLYDVQPATSFLELSVLGALALHVSILALCLKGFRRYRLLAGGIFFFYIALAVESSVVPLMLIAAEHRLYVPMLGFCIAGLGVLDLFQHKLTFWANKMPEGAKTGYLPLLVIIMLAWPAHIVIQDRIDEWKDPKLFWQKNMERHKGHPFSYIEMARINSKEGNLIEAKDLLESALKLHPTSAVAHNNLGLVLDQTGDTAQALKHYRYAAEAAPLLPSPWVNIANYHFKKGEYELAIEYFSKALAIDPHFPVALRGLNDAASRLQDQR